jgi:hypothetical protein
MQPYGQSQSQMQPYGQSQSNMGMGLGGLGNAYASRQQMSQWNQPQQWQPQQQSQIASEPMPRAQTLPMPLQQPLGEQNGLARRDMTQTQNPAMQVDSLPSTSGGQAAQSATTQQGQIDPVQNMFQNYQQGQQQVQQQMQPFGGPNGQYQQNPSASGKPGSPMGGQQPQQMNQYARSMSQNDPSQYIQ